MFSTVNRRIHLRRTAPRPLNPFLPALTRPPLAGPGPLLKRPARSHFVTAVDAAASKVVLGNLLTIPLAGKVLYVEPVYTQAQGGDSFPILRHVIAVYGDGQPAFEPTLAQALRQAIANDRRAG